MAQHAEDVSFFDQPRAVWATGFACVVGFMSIGLVDPILTSIAAGLRRRRAQVSLLFTSYFLVTSLMMLVTGFVSSRLGGRRTLMLGAALIVVFSALAGTSNSVDRAGAVSRRLGPRQRILRRHRAGGAGRLVAPRRELGGPRL